MRGRPPKPSNQKRLAGNPGKRKLDHDPRPAGGPPDMPYGFKSRYPHEAKLWEQVSEAMEDANILTSADAFALRMMLHHYKLALESIATLNEEGLTRKDENGVERKHPLLQIFRDNSKMALSYMDRLGMNPSARARLNVEPQAEQLSLAEQLFQLVNDVEEKDGKKKSSS